MGYRQTELSVYNWCNVPLAVQSDQALTLVKLPEPSHVINVNLYVNDPQRVIHIMQNLYEGLKENIV